MCPQCNSEFILENVESAAHAWGRKCLACLTFFPYGAFAGRLRR